MEEENKIITLTPEEQSFIRPLLLEVKLGEKAKEHLGDFMRMVLRQKGFPDDSNAFLDMQRGEKIVLMPEPTSSIVFPGGKPN